MVIKEILLPMPLQWAKGTKLEKDPAAVEEANDRTQNGTYTYAECEIFVLLFGTDYPHDIMLMDYLRKCEAPHRLVRHSLVGKCTEWYAVAVARDDTYIVCDKCARNMGVVW